MKDSTKYLLIIGLVVMLVCGILALTPRKQKPSETPVEQNTPVEYPNPNQEDPNAPPIEDYLHPNLPEYIPSNTSDPFVLTDKSEDVVIKVDKDYKLDLAEDKPTWLSKIYEEQKAEEYSFTNSTDIPLDIKLVLGNLKTDLPTEELRIFSPYTGELMMADDTVLYSGRVYPGESTPVIPVYYYIDYYIKDYVEDLSKGGSVTFNVQLETSPAVLYTKPIQDYFVSYENNELLFDSLLYEISIGEENPNTRFHKITIDGIEYDLVDEGQYVAGDDYVHDINLNYGQHEVEITVNGYTYKDTLTIN